MAAATESTLLRRAMKRLGWSNAEDKAPLFSGSAKVLSIGG